MGVIMVYSIDNSMLLGVDIVELVGGYYYNGYLNKIIGYWIVGYGYISFGGMFKFVDLLMLVWLMVSLYFVYFSFMFVSWFL